MAVEASSLKAKHVDVHLLPIKDLGRVSKFLGTQNGDGGYNIDQEGVIGNLLRTNGLKDANSVRALIGDDCYDENLDGVEMLGASNKRSGPTIREFQSLVGSLLWVARCKKPDIAFAGTVSLKVTIAPAQNRDQKVSRRGAFSNADSAVDKADRKSMTGSVLRLHGMAREVLGLREMLSEIGIAPAVPMPLQAPQNGDGGYNIDQEGVIGNLLRTKGLKDANSVRALIGDDCYDENLDGVEMLGASNKRSGPTIREFQLLVGSLLWVARCKKPDIAFAGTVSLKVTIAPAQNRDQKVSRRGAFSNADSAVDKADRKSMTGSVLRLHGMAREVLGLREMLSEIGIAPAVPMPLQAPQNGDGGYNIDQEGVIGNLLRTKGLKDANSVRALIGDDCYDENLDGVEMLGASNKRSGPTIREFQLLVGSLLWVARCKKPDIAFAGTVSLKVTIAPAQNRDQKVSRRGAFSNADSAVDKADRKSMTGSVLRLHGMAVSRGAHKQGGVSLSMMKADFVAVS
ncbi:unnamed protein product [Peronospora belbahrii]|uniref:Uncharacterized protein n=2 Tax=Peronospora belbahrii TaxID=622444 RepID=A0AAU9KNY6_9STRA|nr:unnamed protein product [Peronospora belbahrii]